VEQTALEREGEGSPETIGRRVAESLITALREHGAVSSAELASAIESIDAMGTKSQGPRIVARAWSDPEFRRELAEDAGPAVARVLGVGGGAQQNAYSTKLTAVMDEPGVKNVIVCTLCSCYPLAILGLSPPWYKSRAYRARCVREPRRLLLEEFGTVLPPGTQLRVHDSTADLRYMHPGSDSPPLITIYGRISLDSTPSHRYICIPERPPGTDGWSEERLAELVTRDSMIGARLVQLPAV